MKLTRDCGKIIFIVLTTEIIWVTAKRYHNCSVGIDCLKQNESNNITRDIIKKDVELDELSAAENRLEHASARSDIERGSKRDNSFTDVMQNFLKLIQKARAVISSDGKATNLSATTPSQPTVSPSSPSPSVEVTSAATIQGVVTSPAPGVGATAATVTQPVSRQPATVPTMAPATTKHGQFIVATAPVPTPAVELSGKPGQNFHIIILHPNLTSLSPKGHTIGSSGIPGVSPLAIIGGGVLPVPIGVPYPPGSPPPTGSNTKETGQHGETGE